MAHPTLVSLLILLDLEVVAFLGKLLNKSTVWSFTPADASGSTHTCVCVVCVPVHICMCVYACFSAYAYYLYIFLLCVRGEGNVYSLVQYKFIHSPVSSVVSS